MHLRVPGGHQGARLRRARAQRRVRPGVRPGARDDAARRLARARLLRALRGRVHARRARGPAADPPPQALHRRRAVRPGGAARPSRSPSRTARRSPSWARARPASPPPGSSRARATASRSTRRPSAPGGMLALGIPAYRLPNDVVDDDIGNVTAIGVEIETGVTGRRSGEAQGRRVRRRPRGDGHAQGRAAARARRGQGRRHERPHLPRRRQARQERRPRRPQGPRGRRRQRGHRRGAHGAPPRRRGGPPGQPRVLRGHARPRLRGRGGQGRGHHAARRLGRRTTSPATARSRAPSSRSAPASSTPSGKFAPEYDESQQQTVACDVVIVAAGMGADTEAFGLETNPQPDAQGRRRHAADGGAAHLRRRRRRHRPHDDHHRRRPGPPRGLHDRPLSSRARPWTRTRSTRRSRSRTRRACSRGRTSTTGASRSSRTPR